MLFQGKSLTAELLADGIVEMQFNAQGSVNKFDQATFEEFVAVIDAIKNCADAKGVLVTSGKSTFIVGADITEFLETFKRPEDELIPWVKNASDIFSSVNLNSSLSNSLDRLAWSFLLPIKYKWSFTKCFLSPRGTTIGFFCLASTIVISIPNEIITKQAVREVQVAAIINVFC